MYTYGDQIMGTCNQEPWQSYNPIHQNPLLGIQYHERFPMQDERFPIQDERFPIPDEHPTYTGVYPDTIHTSLDPNTNYPSSPKTNSQRHSYENTLNTADPRYSFSVASTDCFPPDYTLDNQSEQLSDKFANSVDRDSPCSPQSRYYPSPGPSKDMADDEPSRRNSPVPTKKKTTRSHFNRSFEAIQAAKRTHTAVEKSYRNRLNDRINALAHHLFAYENSVESSRRRPKPPKCLVISRAKERIEQLETQNSALENNVEGLKQRIAVLNHLVAVLGGNRNASY